MRDKFGKYIKGFKPESGRAFKKGQHASSKTEFKKGINNFGQNNGNWKGGRVRGGANNYIYKYAPNHPSATKLGYVMEHRLVVEAQISRYLKPEEEIHHLGAKDDNRPHMLMAFANISAHQRFERNKIVNLEEIIFDGRRYGK